MSGQDGFRAALLDAALPVPPQLTDGAGRPAGRRFAVYRNNVAVGLADALEAGFPVLRQLLGPENFRHIAGLYLRQHPPSSPLMMHYGQRLPGFLAGFAPVRHLGYLPDVARLELALRQSYHAADATPLAHEALAAVPPESLGAHRVILAPSLRLLRSDWPLHAIWAFNTTEGAPQPQPGAQDVLVTRPLHDPVPRLLPQGAADFIAALIAGDSIDQAAEAAPGCDLPAVITLLLQDNCLISLETAP